MGQPQSPFLSLLPTFSISADCLAEFYGPQSHIKPSQTRSIQVNK